MRRSKVTASVAVVLTLCLGAACGGRKVTADAGGTGGSPGSGGGSSVGPGGTGGSVATGGASTGGTVATGGSVATGGASTGGTVGTGGSVATGGASTGGTVATGGSVATGGASTGGSVGTGGSIATGGVSTGGSVGTGGVAAIGGASADGGGGGGSAGVGGAAGGAAGENGCPQEGTVLNAGCATRALGELIASPADHALLSCQILGPCHRWRISVNCADQSLTAGVVNGQPACVCRPGGDLFGSPTTTTLYVDPDPPPSTYQQGAPTGVINPPACRYRTLTQAFAAAVNAPSGTFNRVEIRHESSSYRHLTAEPLPLEVPPGVAVASDADGTFGPTPPTIDLGGGPTPRVVLGNGASLLGITLNGTATNNPLGGTAMGTVMVATSITSPGGTAALRNVYLLGTPGSAHTGVLVRGSATMTVDRLFVSDMNVGIDVRVTDPTVGAMATFTGSAITIRSTSPLAIGARVGPAGSVLTVTGTSIQVPGTAILVEGGQATLNGVPVP